MFTASWIVCVTFGAFTSSCSQVPPKFSNCFTSSGVLEGLRDVAITLCPAFRAISDNEEPKPELHPVINQTNGGIGLLRKECRLKVRIIR